MSNTAPNPEDLEKRTKKLADLGKERPGTLVAVQYGYHGEFFVSVGFTNRETVSEDTITLDNGINEIPLHEHASNFMQVYIEEKHFTDYTVLDKKQEPKQRTKR